MGQFPALALEFALDRGTLGSIDGGGEARDPVMDQDTVIVLAADEMMEIKLSQYTVSLEVNLAGDRR